MNQHRNRIQVRFIDKKIIDCANIEELGTELCELVEPNRRIVLNLEGVEFMSSSGLGKLIELNTQLKRVGGRLRLCNVRSEIQEVFRITRLSSKFDIRNTDRDDDELETWGAWVPNPNPTDDLDGGIEMEEPRDDE